MSKLGQITSQYWEQEARLAAFADSFGVTRQDLIDHADQFAPQVREQIAEILWKQVDLLQAGHAIKRAEITGYSVVDLSAFRRFVS